MPIKLDKKIDTNMPKVALDLDSTVFVNIKQYDSVNFDLHNHNGVWISAKVKRGSLEKLFPIVIINPEKLSALIEYAYSNHDGIMILTAGFWDEISIKNILTTHLDLSDKTCEKVNKCDFLTPGNTTHHFPDLTLTDIQYLPKNERLNKYIKLRPDLKDTHFVLVDDSMEHVKSCDDDENDHFTAIYASTGRDDIIDLGKREDNVRLQAYLESKPELKDKHIVLFDDSKDDTNKAIKSFDGNHRVMVSYSSTDWDDIIDLRVPYNEPDAFYQKAMEALDLAKQAEQRQSTANILVNVSPNSPVKPVSLAKTDLKRKRDTHEPEGFFKKARRSSILKSTETLPENLPGEKDSDPSFCK